MLSIVGAGLTVGATFMPGTANSAAPSFGAWSASSGAITGCPSGYSCTNLVTGDGFRQAQVSDGAGNSFVWTVVTDTGASGNPPGSSGAVPFSDENFVVTSNSGVTGVADKQSISDSSNGQFDSTVSVLTGFAAPTGGTSSVQINQSLAKDTGLATAFNTSFAMTVNLNSTGVQTGRSMNIDQVTNLNSTTDKQVFAIRGRSGTFLTSTASSSLTLGAGTSTSSVTWNTGDDVMLTWVGQGLTLGGLGASQFGFEGITNNTSASTASTFSQANTGPTTAPFKWPTADGNNDFGAAPVY